MAKLNLEEVLIIESDKENKITYVELPNGAKKWVNNSELEYSEPQEEKFKKDVVKKPKK